MKPNFVYACIFINSVPADHGWWWRPCLDLELDLFLVHVTTDLRLVDITGLKNGCQHVASTAGRASAEPVRARGEKKYVTAVANKETVIDSG